MDKMTELIIHALKVYDGPRDARIRKAMAEYTGTENWDGGRDLIDKILRQTCTNFIAASDDPMKELRRYFYNDSMLTSEYERMTIFLTQATVREKDKQTGEYHFVNNFSSEIWSKK